MSTRHVSFDIQHFCTYMYLILSGILPSINADPCVLLIPSLFVVYFYFNFFNVKLYSDYICSGLKNFQTNIAFQF